MVLPGCAFFSEINVHFLLLFHQFMIFWQKKIRKVFYLFNFCVVICWPIFVIKHFCDVKF